MATISNFDIEGSTHPSRATNVQVPYVISRVVDWSKVLAAKGSALAASDVVNVLRIPAETVIMGAWAKVDTAADSTTLTLHLGNVADPQEWAVSLNGKVTGYAPNLNSDTTYKLITTADTIDLTLATLTGTLTSGKVLVSALVFDLSKVKERVPGIAQLKS